MRALVLLAAVLLVTIAISYFAIGLLAAPNAAVIGPPPPDLKAESVGFQSQSGSYIRGWFIAGKGDAPVIILMHGIRANRLSMIDRARFLAVAGYSVLLFDFQGSGESPGEQITFGYLEAMDARAAVRYVRGRLPGAKIGVIGSSLGGAASVLGDRPLQVEGLVLEAVYPTIEEAISNRLALRLGHAGRHLAPLLVSQIDTRLGVDPKNLRPIERMLDIGCPLLLVAGERDDRTTLEESQRLFRAAPEPKEIWIIKDASHVDFHRHAPAEYEARILGFFSQL